MRRRSAKAIKLACEGGGDPVRACFCGSQAWHYNFARWPMAWTATCRVCGLVTSCGLQTTPPKPKPDPPLGYQGYPPFYDY